jgi:hypothetical protein
MIINFKYTTAVYVVDGIKIFAVKVDGKRTQKEMKDFISDFITEGKIKILTSYHGTHEMIVSKNESITSLDMLSDIELSDEINGMCRKIESAMYETK